MTSAYEQTPSVQTLREEEGRLEVTLTGDLKKCHLFLTGMSEKHSFVFVVSANDRGHWSKEVDLSLKIDFS